jgi:hypothetical protein
VGLALRFRLPLFWIGYSPCRGKVGRLGLARYFGPTSERKSGLLTIDGNPASANFLEPGKHGSSTLRIQIPLNAHSRFLRTWCAAFTSSRGSSCHLDSVRRPLVPISRLVFLIYLPMILG